MLHTGHKETALKIITLFMLIFNTEDEEILQEMRFNEQTEIFLTAEEMIKTENNQDCVGLL
jgi:hypothetical protein